LPSPAQKIVVSDIAQDQSPQVETEVVNIELAQHVEHVLILRARSV